MANSIINQIKNKINIVDVVSEYIPLAKKGKNSIGLCPFHADNNPSLSVSFEKQLFKCFVCGNGGDVIKFVSDFNKISFQEALKILGEKAGVEVKVNEEQKHLYSKKEQQLLEVLQEAMSFYQYSISTEQGVKALEYAEKRNLNTKIREEFLIGYAPTQGLKEFLEKKNYDKSLIINASLLNSYDQDFFQDRLIFGLTNQYGDVVGFSARDLSGEHQVKYINSAQSILFSKSTLLYNYSNTKQIILNKKQVFINEGFMDVIAMNKAGYKNSVAIMGTALTKEHISFLRKNEVVLMLDGDKAGILATINSIKILLDNNIKTFVVVNNYKKDPDEILQNYGVEKLREVVENQIEALEFIFENHQERFKNLTPDNIEKFINSFCQYINKSSIITKEFYANKLSQHLNISKEIILKRILKTNFPKINIPNLEKKKSSKSYENKEIYFSVYYKLMKTILGKPHLAKIVQNSKINYSSLIEKKVANYIINITLQKISTAPIEYKEIFQKILKVPKSILVNEYDNENAIKDLIEKLNNETINKNFQKYNVKLENKSTLTDEEKILILEGQIKIKQKK